MEAQILGHFCGFFIIFGLLGVYFFGLSPLPKNLNLKGRGLSRTDEAAILYLAPAGWRVVTRVLLALPLLLPEPAPFIDEALPLFGCAREEFGLQVALGGGNLA